MSSHPVGAKQNWDYKSGSYTFSLVLSSFYHPEGTNIVFLTSGSSLSRPLVFIERFILKHWKLAFKPIVAKGSTPGFSASEWRNAKQINNFQKIIPSLKKKRTPVLRHISSMRWAVSH